MATTFSEAMERAPLRAFQVATFVICMLVALPSLVLLAWLQRRGHFAALQT